MRPRLSATAALLALLAFTPVAAFAHAVIVGPSAPATYSHINDALVAFRASFGSIDSILVMPGTYAETVGLENESYFVLIRALAAPESTVVSAVAFARGANSYTTMDGFTFGSLVTNAGVRDDGFDLPRFRHCVFAHGVKFDVFCREVSLFDCTIRGDSELLGCETPAFTTLSGLRFEGCGLTLKSGCGDVRLERSQFVNCPGTALRTISYSDETVHVIGCTFDSCAVAIAATGSYQASRISGCRFRDCGVGVTPYGGGVVEYSRVALSDNRFTRVGHPIQTEGAWSFSSDADTVEQATGPALDVALYDGALDGLVVVGAGAPSVVRCVAPFSGLTVDGCTFRNSAGGGLSVRAESLATGTVAVRRCTFADNRGTGLAVSGHAITATHDVAFDNEGAGFTFTLEPGAGTDSVAYNTSVFNLGDGIGLSPAAGGMAADVVVARNLVSLNAGAGVRAGAGFTGTFAGNDAWLDYGPAYAGVVANASNLAADPFFCGLLGGNLTVAADSPCAPGMPSGPIGAYGVGCGAVAGVPTGTLANALGVQPSPARGMVEFTLAPAAAAGRIEVLDAQGRRVWSAPLAPGTPFVRWRGECERGGAADAGVYWARVVRGEETRTRRFVWLR